MDGYLEKQKLAKLVRYAILTGGKQPGELKSKEKITFLVTASLCSTAATGLFGWRGKIESRLLKFCQSHDSAKFKQPPGQNSPALAV